MSLISIVSLNKYVSQ